MKKFVKPEVEFVNVKFNDVVVASCHGYCSTVCPGNCYDVCANECQVVSK